MLEMDMTGWMFFSHVERWSLMVVGEMTLVMAKGPAHLWSSFFMGQSEEYFWDLTTPCLLLCTPVHSDGSSCSTASYHQLHVQGQPSLPPGYDLVFVQRCLWLPPLTSEWVPPQAVGAGLC